MKCLLLSVFVLHPIFSKTITHVGVRKHLLSFLFIVFFMNIYLSDKKDGWRAIKMTTFFVLSLLSQPINIFVPIWCFFHSYFVKKHRLIQIIKELSPLFLCALIIGILNIWWYLSYQKILGVHKYVEDDTFALRLMAIGRYYSFYFLPIRFAEFYGPQSFLTIVGIGIAPIFYWVCVKRINLRIFLIYALLFYVALTPVILQMFYTFASETYFLLAATALFILTLFLLEDIQWTKVKIIPILIIGFFLGLQTTKIVHSRMSVESMRRSSYENDPNCINLYYLVHCLFAQEKIDEATTYGNEMVVRQCFWTNRESIHMNMALFAKVLLFAKTDLPDRERQLLAFAQQTYYLKLHLALFYLMNNQSSSFNEIIQEGIDNNVLFDKNEFIFKQIIQRCKNQLTPGCLALEAIKNK